MTPAPSFSRSRFQLARWSVFLVLMVSYLLVYFHRIAPGVMSGDLMSAFRISGTALGSLAAMYFYVYSLMQIPSGVLADTLGTRRAITVGHASAAIGAILFATAGSFAVASVGRLMIGLGVSTFYASIMKSHAMWFSERRYGLMSGLTILVGNLGAVMAAAPLALAIEAFSWRGVFLGMGLVSVLLGVTVFAVVRDRPEHAGFPPIWEIEGGRLVQSRQQHWLRDFWSVVRVPQVWPCFWVNFGLGGTMFTFIGLWGVSYLRDVHGLTRGEASSYLTVMLLACAAGSLFFGWLSDRLGRRKPVLIAGVGVCLISWCALTWLPWSPGLGIHLLLCIMGFSQVCIHLIAPCVKEVVDPNLAGTAIGLVNSANFLGTSLLQPLFGWVLDLTWNGTQLGGVRVYSSTDYRHGFCVLLVFAFVGALGLLKVPETRCRSIYRPSGDRENERRLD